MNKGIGRNFVIFWQKKGWILLMLLAFASFVWLLHWNSFSSPWEGDEGEYAYSAWLLSQDISPYENSFLQKPPLIVYTYYLSHLIFPFSIWAPRLLAFLFTLGIILLLTLIAKKIYGARIAVFVLWISPIFLAAISFDALPANTERFMLLPLTGLLALFVYQKKTKKPVIYFLAGALAALAFLYKQIAVLPVIIILSYWLLTTYRLNRSGRQFLKNSLFMFIGAILVTFLSFLYFILKGSFADLWQQAFVFNLGYAATTKEYFPETLFRYLKVYFYLFWPVIVLSPFFFWSKAKQGYLWLVLLLSSLLTIMTTSIPHYYLLLAPFIILLAAEGLSGLLERVKINSSRSWLAMIAIVIVVGTFSAKVGEQFFLRPLEIPKWLWTKDNNWGDVPLLVEKIRGYTKPGEKIFIAGSESQIYYFSQRQAATKFNITFPLSLPTPQVSKYQEEAVEALKSSSPAAIVFPLGNSGLQEDKTPTRFLNYLYGELEDNYTLIGGTVSYYQNFSYLGPRWLEPEQIDLNNKNIMLLFLRDD